MSKIEVAVSVAIGMMRVEPSGSPAIASRGASLAPSAITSAPPADFGSMMPSGVPASTASRSSSINPVPSAFTRT